MTRLSRREALGRLGTSAGGGLLALHGLGLDAQAPTFPRAIIRTLLKDVAPDTITGSTLFHEHLSIRYPLTRRSPKRRAGRCRRASPTMSI